MKRINCLFVPNIGTADTVQGYTVIRFPTIEKDLQDLVDIKNAEISCRIDTRQDLLHYIKEGYNVFPFKVTETRHAPSFEIAISWFNRMTRAG